MIKMKKFSENGLFIIEKSSLPGVWEIFSYEVYNDKDRAQKDVDSRIDKLPKDWSLRIKKLSLVK